VSICTGHRARAFPPILLLRYPLRCTGPRDFNARDFSALEVAGAMAKGEGRLRPRLARSNLSSFPSALDRARHCPGGMRAR
jgi:hypothetical protein